MATVKFYLRKKVLKDGTSPLVLKIIKDGKPSISRTEIRLLHKDWDATKRRVRSSHPSATQLNIFLKKRLAEAVGTAIETETINNNVSSKALIKKIKPNSGLNFLKYAQGYAATLRQAGKYTEWNSAIAGIEHFSNFLNGSDISFPDITVSLLERYKTYLFNEVKTGRREKPLSPVTVINKLAFIRTVFNQAITAKDVEQKHYPFGKGGMELKAPETAKRGLSVDDVIAIETVELVNPKYNHARNLWLVSLYCGGMRASDVLRLKWSDFKDSKLHYTMGKNNKAGSFTVPKNVAEKMADILLQYEGDKRHSDDYIFPELKIFLTLGNKFEVKKYISSTVSTISGVLRNHVAPLAGVDGKLSMHIARHTFGNLAAEMNMSLATLQKIFRHSSILTTMNYMKSFMDKDIGDAMETVFDFNREIKLVAV